MGSAACPQSCLRSVAVVPVVRGESGFFCQGQPVAVFLRDEFFQPRSADPML